MGYRSHSPEQRSCWSRRSRLSESNRRPILVSRPSRTSTYTGWQPAT